MGGCFLTVIYYYKYKDKEKQHYADNNKAQYWQTT